MQEEAGQERDAHSELKEASVNTEERERESKDRKSWSKSSGGCAFRAKVDTQAVFRVLSTHA